MADDDWYKPRRPPAPPRQPKPGELLFEFYRERDHSRWLCELRDDGEEYSVMAQSRAGISQPRWTFSLNVVTL